MKKGIIGKKLGMTQIFDEIGNVIPVTLIEAGPCVVVQKKTTENDGYDAVQLGFEDAKEKHLTKAQKRSFCQGECSLQKTSQRISFGQCLRNERRRRYRRRYVHCRRFCGCDRDHQGPWLHGCRKTHGATTFCV